MVRQAHQDVIIQNADYFVKGLPLTKRSDKMLKQQMFALK